MRPRTVTSLLAILLEKELPIVLVLECSRLSQRVPETAVGLPYELILIR